MLPGRYGFDKLFIRCTSQASSLAGHHQTEQTHTPEYLATPREIADFMIARIRVSAIQG